MKVTYLQILSTRAGMRIPIQDVEHGEKFRVVSEKGQYLTGYGSPTLLTHPREQCEKFRRRDDHLYQLKSSRHYGTKTFTWKKVCDSYFKDEWPSSPWMSALQSGKAEIIVEIY